MFAGSVIDVIKKLLKYFLIFCGVLIVVGAIFGDGEQKNSSTNSTPTTKTEQPAPVKQAEPAKSSAPEKKSVGTRYMVKVKQDIERITKHYVTDSWILEYGERENKDGTIDSHGFVEIDDDGVKRQFWALYDGKTDEILRLKIGPTLIFTKVGW